MNNEYTSTSFTNINENVIRTAFISVHRVDLRQGDVQTVHPSEGMDDYSGKLQSYEDLLRSRSPLYHPEDQPRFLKEFDLHTIRTEKAKEAEHYERDYRRLVGENYCWISNCLYFNSAFGPDTAIWVQSDVSDRHLSLNLIESLSEEYFALYYIDMQTDSSRILRSDTKVAGKLSITVHSKASRKLREYCEEFVHPEDRDAYARVVDYHYLRKTLSSRQKSVVFSYRKQVNHHYEWMEMKLVLNESFSQVPRYITLAIRNINSRMKQELENRQILEDALRQAEYASMAKSDFLFRMSHDIRTPMNAIIGMTSIAKARVYEPMELKNYLNKIEIAGNHLLNLVNEILDMHRIESGMLHLHDEPFDLPELMRQTIALNLPSLMEKDLEITLHMDDITHYQVMGDSSRLQQVFANILSNAIKYTPAGGNIHIDLKEIPVKSGKTGQFLFTCQDTGIGIHSEFLPHIFEPYAREEESLTDTVTGMGLGLTRVNSIVKMMDGDIKINSVPGKGSTFTVSFGLRLAQSEPPRSREAESEDTLAPFACQHFPGRRFLIVDDNDLNLEITQEMLELTSAIVETAVNGEEAVQKFLSHPAGYYNLILMDIQMPIMNGLTASRTIRSSKHPDAQSIPIIALTANAFSEDVRKSLEYGMTAHLAKPVDLRKMTQLIFDVLD